MVKNLLITEHATIFIVPKCSKTFRCAGDLIMLHELKPVHVTTLSKVHMIYFLNNNWESLPSISSSSSALRQWLDKYAQFFHPCISANTKTYNA